MMPIVRVRKEQLVRRRAGKLSPSVLSAAPELQSTTPSYKQLLAGLGPSVLPKWQAWHCPHPEQGKERSTGSAFKGHDGNKKDHRQEWY